jgi:hypothetical protein
MERSEHKLYGRIYPPCNVPEGNKRGINEISLLAEFIPPVMFPKGTRGG